MNKRRVTVWLCLGGQSFRTWHGHWFVGPGHIPLEHHTDTFQNTQEDGTGDGGVQHVSSTTSDGKRTTNTETSHDSVPRILSLSDRLDPTVVEGEQTTPDTEITTDDRRTGLDGREHPDSTFSVRRVTEPLDPVPHRPTNDTHGKGTTEIIQNDNRTWVSRMISFWC